MGSGRGGASSCHHGSHRKSSLGRCGFEPRLRERSLQGPPQERSVLSGGLRPMCPKDVERCCTRKSRHGGVEKD